MMALEKGYALGFHAFQTIGQGILAGRYGATLPLVITALPAQLLTISSTIKRKRLPKVLSLVSFQ
jgi:hypothetical protein